MDFDLSDEQRMLQETVAGFLENECPMPRLRELFDDETGWDPALWKGLAELGVAGIHLPGEYGGSEMEILDLAVIAEVVGAAAAPVPILSHSLAALAILEAGSDAQKSRWLPRLAGGDLLGTVALAEAERGWQPEDWTIAPGASISGTKESVEFGEQADLFVVGLAGGRLGVVERSAPGVEIQRVEASDRTRRITRVSFEKTPIELLEREPAAAAARMRDVGLVLLAADAFGGATKLVEASVAYAKTREQFGVTIGHFQALKHQLADMAVETEPNRALYWYAAHAQDHVREEAPRIAAIAKSHITDRFQQVARDATEAHGGIGYTWEGDTQILFKRAMFD
ncbi:MAG: acyl-CoA/acyl-ACP dehydrogenase, partial [Myxococcales bacterium]|nr:acyl-CoA/acyl-ACP dehydrogenase [Myxococcales bacterium]